MTSRHGPSDRPLVLVIGVGRAVGIGAGVARRLAASEGAVHLVDFLCSPQGEWVNGQLLMSNGGFA